jgi:parvulin-like peptidyl-prolyl isomerase
MRAFRSAPFLLSALLAGGCASTSYLAKVNDATITGKDLQDEFVRRHGGHKKFLAGTKEVNDFLNVMIDWRLLVQESYRLDLESQPDIRKAVAEYSDRKAAEYLVKVEIDEKAKPTAEEVKKIWQQETIKLRQARQIVLDTKPEAESVQLQLFFGADFDLLARQCSIAASRIQGGKLPYVGWGAMEPAWEDAVFPLSPGETTPVFETREGFQIVQLSAVDVVELPDETKATSRIEAILKKRMLEQRRHDLSEYLWTKYHARQTIDDLGPESLHATLTNTPDAIIATWDGGSLKAADFLRGLDWNDFAGLLPGRFQDEMERQLRQTVNAPLAILEARARGYENVPEVAQAISHYQDDLVENALYADYIVKGVTVSDEDVRRYYDAHRAEMTAPEKRRVAHIVVATREEAEAIQKDIQEGQKFEALVERSTDTESAKKGGDLGWVTKQDAKGEFETVFAMAEGEISAPMQSKYGFHLVKVTGIVTGQPLDFDEAKEKIRKKLLEEKQREKRKIWVQRLRQQSTIEINEAGIRAFVKANDAS